MKIGIIISNETEFENKKKAMKDGGAEKFHVVADFDRTITYGVTKEGKRTETVISKLRSDPKYLGEKYVEEAHKEFDTYHPIEIDPDVPFGEKVVKMHEWWNKHFNLLIESGLNKSLILQVVKEKPLDFRKATAEFISLLDEKDVPLIFLSAAPGDMIVEYLNSEGMMTEDVHVIANRYEFDNSGKAIRVKEPIIHTFNKEEVSLAGNPVYEKIKTRTNVLLLGDSVGDVGMAEGFPYENIIKIGFLNEKEKESLEDYKKAYDVVLTGDQDFDFVNGLVSEILK